jgi:hypothetical protein
MKNLKIQTRTSKTRCVKRVHIKLMSILAARTNSTNFKYN